MKVVHVQEVANVASTLIEGLRPLGYEAELVPLRAAGAKLPLPIKAMFLPLRLREGAAINRYIKAQGFDVVHIHMAYMGWLGIFGKYPFLLHCHGHDLDTNLYIPILRWATARALRAARRVYYSTPDLYAHVAPFRSDAVFVPNPINVDNFHAPADGQGNHQPRILLISRLWERKGIDVAMAIIRRLKQRQPEVTIDAFAWGPELHRYGDNQDVNFIPTVLYAGMPDLISRYDIIIGQFKLGIMSMSELESMACGKPVLSYFSYGHFYDEPPPLYSTNDVTTAVDYLEALVEDPQLRRQAGERGREWVTKYHDYRRIAKMMANEYDAMVR